MFFAEHRASDELDEQSSAKKASPSERCEEATLFACCLSLAACVLSLSVNAAFARSVAHSEMQKVQR